MQIIPGRYDLSKINKMKAIFKDDGIITKGFVIELLPKIKSFYRYNT